MIYVISSTAVVMNKVNVSNSISTADAALITIHNSQVDEISSSSFSHIQYYVFMFMSSSVKSFNNNVLNGINKGIYFKQNSSAAISN